MCVLLDPRSSPDICIRRPLLRQLLPCPVRIELHRFFFALLSHFGRFSGAYHFEVAQGPLSSLLHVLITSRGGV